MGGPSAPTTTTTAISGTRDRDDGEDANSDGKRHHHNDVIEEGDEIYLSYGLKTASTMYRDYGFVADDFVDELGQFTACFPRPTEEFSTMKFTLTLASEGFGIGMHKHNAAMFMLLLGEKKWYMTSGGDLEGDSETHPGFYREKSSHKCILRKGEILFVPHE